MDLDCIGDRIPDVEIEDQGTIVVFTLKTDDAADWVRENVSVGDWQWLGERTFAVDHRAAEMLIEGMIHVGLEVL